MRFFSPFFFLVSFTIYPMEPAFHFIRQNDHTLVSQGIFISSPDKNGEYTFPADVQATAREVYYLDDLAGKKWEKGYLEKNDLGKHTLKTRTIRPVLYISVLWEKNYGDEYILCQDRKLNPRMFLLLSPPDSRLFINGEEIREFQEGSPEAKVSIYSPKEDCNRYLFQAENSVPESSPEKARDFRITHPFTKMETAGMAVAFAAVTAFLLFYNRKKDRRRRR